MPIPTPSGAEEVSGGGTITEFQDPPLDPVVRDNIDIEVVIGPHPTDDKLIVGEKPDGGRPYHVTELEVHLTDGVESNYVKGVVVPEGHERKPYEGDPPDIITIDANNELRESEDTEFEITRIFTGIISNSSRVRKGSYEFMAFWPGYNELQNGSLPISAPTPQTDSFSYGGRTYTGIDYNNRSQQASIIARNLAERVTSSDGRFQSTILIGSDGVEIGDQVAGIDTEIKLESTHQPITADDPQTGILERIVKSTNSIWDIDRYGTFQIGPPVPDGNIPTAAKSHKIRYFTDTSAGLRSPAWRSVVVIGDGIVSQDGWQSNAQLSKNSVNFAEPVTESLSTQDDILRENLAGPTFEYVNMEINTAKEAEHVLAKIRDEIRKQMAGGEVTLVGYPEIWPGDAIKFPNSKNQPYGLEEFRAAKVIHRFNNSDGYITIVKVAGQTNANEVQFSDEINPLEDVKTGFAQLEGYAEETGLVDVGEEILEATTELAGVGGDEDTGGSSQPRNT